MEPPRGVGVPGLVKTHLFKLFYILAFNSFFKEVAIKSSHMEEWVPAMLERTQKLMVKGVAEDVPRPLLY